MWHPVDVSLGNHGTQAFTGCWHNHFVDSHAILFSSHDSSPASPIWEATDGGEQTLAADSAAHADVHVTTTYENTGTIFQDIRRVNKFSSQGLDWVYTYPQLDVGHQRVGVSNDGEVIVAAIGNPATTGLNDLLVFGPRSPVPVQTFSIPRGTLWGLDLAADGTHVVLAIGSEFYVLNLTNGLLSFLYGNPPATLSRMGLAISGDGSVVGCNISGGMALYEWNGSDYVQTWFRSVAGDAVVDISDDSSTMAYGLDFNFTSQRIITECIDIPSKSVTLTEDITSTGQYGNGIADIAISATGAVFATATWGDEFDLVPEVRIYSRDQSTPIQTLNLPGSALSVDISPDGQWVMAGSDPVHTAQPSIGGRVDLVQVGSSDFVMTGVPSIGNTVRFEVFSQPGRLGYLLDSPNLAVPEVFYPGWGTLYLDLATLTVTPIGMIGPGGSRTIDVTLPSSPSLIGVSHYFQGFSTDPTRRISDNWLVVTHLP